MTNTFNKIASLTLLLACIAITAMLITQKAGASAPSGLPATIATTSVQTVGTTARLLFATSTCATRVISTRAQPMMLSFSDNQGFIPTAINGHLQAASTTVAYDSGQYGCNAVRVISGTPISDTITVSESN